jgi:hypothetical protein
MFDFPTNPPIGQTYISPEGVIYEWNGYGWMRGSGSSANADKYVLKAGDTMLGFLTANADPVNVLHYATKQYVDFATDVATDPEMNLSVRNDVLATPANMLGVIGVPVAQLTTTAKLVVPAINELQFEVDLLAIGAIFVGSFSAAAGTIRWTATSGGAGNALPPAALANKGWYIICDATGTTPPGGAPADQYEVTDWLVSNGAVWTHLFFGPIHTTTASQIAVAPPVAGGTDVQTALEGLATADQQFVVGPPTSLDSTIPLYDGLTGHLIKDSGILLSDVVGAAGDVFGPAASVLDNITTYADATGKLIKDSGQPIARLETFVVGPAASVAGNFATFADITGHLIQDSGISGAAAPWVLKTGDVMSGDLYLPSLWSNNGVIGNQNAGGNAIFGANGGGIYLRPNYTTGAGDVIIDAAGNTTINAALTVQGNGVFNGAWAVNPKDVVTLDRLQNYVNPGLFVPITGWVTMTGPLYFGSGAYYFNVDGSVSSLNLTVAGAATIYGYTTNSGQTCNGNFQENGQMSVTGETHSGGAIRGLNGQVCSIGVPHFYAMDAGWATRGDFYWDPPVDTVVVGHWAQAADPLGFQNNGIVRISRGIRCRQGISTPPGVYGGSSYNFNWSGNMEVWVDAANVGNIQLVSDYRTKKDVTPLPSMWETVKALKPIKYTQKEFQPPSQQNYITGELARVQKNAKENSDIPATEVNTTPMFLADDTERWGFVAHELQETLTMSAATGVKDSPDHVQAPNPFTVIAALTKALQEVMAEVEILKTKVG